MEGSCHSVNYHPLKVSGRGGFELGNSELWGKVRMGESYFLGGGYPECYLQSISFSFFKYFHLSFRQREISILSFNKCAPCDPKSGKLQKPGEGQKFHCGYISWGKVASSLAHSHFEMQDLKNYQQGTPFQFFYFHIKVE